jgi:Fe-S cluster assembly protein SufB
MERPELLQSSDYQFGFTTKVEVETLPKGLNEEIIAAISAKRCEPSWVLDFRIGAYRTWQKMQEPHWADLDYEPIDYQDIAYFSAPKKKEGIESFRDADPEVLKTFQKLGIPLEEQARLLGIPVAVDMVFDSVSIGTTFQEALRREGVILCSMQEAIANHGTLVREYLASVVPRDDNFFAALNAAVFTDGSFVYIPKGVHCPMELATYFRINDRESAQFERTLIIADDDSYVSYLEGCTAPSFDRNQLHAAVVELVARSGAHIKYSTVQNWYPGDAKTGKGGIYNFVTKRALCQGRDSRVSWTQVEVGARITWKYPSCILQGDGSIGEFYSVALTGAEMQADTGTKMIHLGKDTKSTIISKGIACDKSQNSYRGLVKIGPEARGARNWTQCDSLLVGHESSAKTRPHIVAGNKESITEHEATTSKLSEEQLFYLEARGFCREDAMMMIIGGFCRDIIDVLPLEFSVEAKNLLALKLEQSVG